MEKAWGSHPFYLGMVGGGKVACWECAANKKDGKLNQHENNST